MELTKEECDNASAVLQETKAAIVEKDTIKLRDLSDRTIHSSCFFQNPGSITTAVLIYSLGKLIERQDYLKVKSWDSFVKKFNSLLDLATDALNKDKQEAYEKHIERARNLLSSLSLNLKPYIQEVLRKAEINKGGKIYEHGISLEQTAKLLGITLWELSEYTGQRTWNSNFEKTIDVKKRAQMAMEFFS